VKLELNRSLVLKAKKNQYKYLVDLFLYHIYDTSSLNLIFIIKITYICHYVKES